MAYLGQQGRKFSDPAHTGEQWLKCCHTL